MRAPDHLLAHGVPDSFSPGAILSALHASFGVPGEAVGALERTEQGLRIALESAEARRIPTPNLVTVSGRPVRLSRPSDLPSPPPSHVLRISGAKATPAGTLAKLLHEASGFSGEDLGTLRVDGDDVLGTLPRWRYRISDMPTKIGTHGVTAEKKSRE